MSVFSRRLDRAGGVYTNAYGNARDGFNSPSKYAHKNQQLTPNPYRRRETDQGDLTGQRYRSNAVKAGTDAIGTSKYGGYVPGTKLQSGNTFYERIYLNDFSGRGLKDWQQFM